MYRIMLKVKEADNFGSLYKFLTTTDEEGNIIPYEVANDDELDAQVELMLNGEYSKRDFVVVSVKDYNINADIV